MSWVYPHTGEARQEFAVCFHALPVDWRPHPAAWTLAVGVATGRRARPHRYTPTVAVDGF